ncbi:MAG: outer membrane protein assembly factor BamD [Phycisphaeraceae bacterium]|nr:outer membrane protein assembly factor BamD [Phycisphaeraceae bacterium]
MRQRNPANFLAAALTLCLACASARAQQSTYELDDAGDWVRTRTPDPDADEGRIAEARRLLAAGDTKAARAIVTNWLSQNQRSDSPWLAEAYLLRGDVLTASGDEYKALYDYEMVINSFPGSAAFASAVERELDIGTRYLHGLKRKVFGLRIDSGKTIGVELLMRVQERLPGSAIAERAALELADYFYRERELEMAAEMYGIFLTNYPQSQHRRKAMLRRIYANLGRFKGPEYDGTGLIEARALIEDFRAAYPADAEDGGITEALLARIDESAAAERLAAARWYLARGDGVSARMSLKRLARRHPHTVAASRAVAALEHYGWLEPADLESGAGGLPYYDDEPTQPAHAEEGDLP